MGQYLLLDTINMSEHFFENAQLFGIMTHLKPMHLCHHLNRLLRIDLCRNFDIDWIQKNNKVNFKEIDSNKLFDNIGSSDEDTTNPIVEFPVFNYIDDNSDIEYYLYTNVLQNNVYLKKQKEVNYFFLVKNGLYIDFIKEMNSILSNHPDILLCKKYDISTCTWKEHLII